MTLALLTRGRTGDTAGIALPTNGYITITVVPSVPTGLDAVNVDIRGITDAVQVAVSIPLSVLVIENVRYAVAVAIDKVAETLVAVKVINTVSVTEKIRYGVKVTVRKLP